jgi:hypothetical protein
MLNDDFPVRVTRTFGPARQFLPPSHSKFVHCTKKQAYLVRFPTFADAPAAE